MSEQPSADRIHKPSRLRRWLRRRLQLRLRTLLLLTAAAAVAVWWWQQPHLAERVLPNGLHVREHFRLLSSEGGGETERRVRHGPFRVADDLGWVLCRGSYRDGSPSGRWTYYYPNRRRQASGHCREGDLVGRWKTWHPNGHLRSVVQYERPHPGAVYHQGPAEWRHANGRLRCQGRFELGFRHGHWRHWNEQGTLVAEGDYEQGLREGEWLVADSAGQRQVTCRAGRPADAPDWPASRPAAQLLTAMRTGDFDSLLKIAESDSPDRALAAIDGLWRSSFETDSSRPSAAQLERIGRLTAHEDRELQVAAAVALAALDARQAEQQLGRLAEWCSSSQYLRNRAAARLVAASVEPRAGYVAWLKRDLPRVRLAIACLDIQVQDQWLDDAQSLLEDDSVPPEVRVLLRQRLKRRRQTSSRGGEFF